MVVQKLVFMGGQPAAIAFAEPRLLKDIDHPRIVRVFETQVDPNNPEYVSIVMPYYSKGSVEDAIRTGQRYSIAQALEFNRDALSGLAYLQDELGGTGYIDRDYKLSNILISDDDRHGLLSDLGSAARIEPDGTVPTGGFTPPYLAPEGWGAGTRLTKRSDVYAACMTLLETLNGRVTWEGLDRADVEARLARGLRGVPDARLAFAPQIPRSLRRTIKRGLNRDPSRRQSDAFALLSELRNIDCIDWKRTVQVDDTEGVWEGVYVPRRRGAPKRWFQVSVQPARGGRLKAVARQRAAAGAEWRRFGIRDVDLARGDVPELSHLFTEVEARAAQ
jgi:serine/threonine protein kinase